MSEKNSERRKIGQQNQRKQKSTKDLAEGNLRMRRMGYGRRSLCGTVFSEIPETTQNINNYIRSICVFINTN